MTTSRRGEGRIIDHPDPLDRSLEAPEGGPVLVALAAGVGSRYGGLKQLEPVGPGGETLLEYSVFDALRAGFSRVVLVVRPETEAVFRQRFEEGMARQVCLSYVHQTLDGLPEGFSPAADRSKPWGTGQAVLSAERSVDGAFAVVNADDFYGAHSLAVLADFLSRPATDPVPTMAMVGFEVGSTLSDSGPVSRALCQLDDQGHLARIIEVLEMWKRDGAGLYRDERGEEVTVAPDQMVSMNIWGFIPEIFAELRNRFQVFLEDRGGELESEFLVPEVVQALILEGKATVEVLPHNGHCYGITYPEDRRQVAELLVDLTASGEYPQRLWG